MSERMNRTGQRRAWWVVCAMMWGVGCGPTQDPSLVNNTTGMTTGGTTSDMGGEDQGGEGVEVSVASFNVRQLFNTSCDSGICGSDEFEKLPSGGEFEARVAQLQEAVQGLNADVVVFQEIETLGAFNALTETFKESYPTREFGEIGGSATLDVGVMARWPVVEVRRHKEGTSLTTATGSRTSFARELLEVHMSKEGRRVVVFAAHFTSKASDRNGARREAEADKAAALAMATAAEFPDALVVLGGDLNDTTDSSPLSRMTMRGLANTSTGQPLETYYSYVYQGARQVIDHVLYAPGDHVEFLSERSRAFHDGTSGYGGSDHGAVRATFVLR